MDENSELPLHLKYRPAIWEEIIGNEKAVGSLQAVIKSKARPHAFLLSGPSGCGKTSIGRIIAGELGAIGRDFHELNAGNFRGIDTARNLITGAWLRPWGGKATVFLLDEAHALTIEAQTALLKLLEEPPKHAYFILATTEPEKLLPTVLSRCTVFTVKRLPPNVVMGRLKEILKLEGNKETYPMNSVLRQISDKCAGSMREALNMLVQVKDHNNENYALELNAPQHLIPQRGSRGVASGHWNGNSSASIFSPTLVKRVGPGAAAYLNWKSVV